MLVNGVETELVKIKRGPPGIVDGPDWEIHRGGANPLSDLDIMVDVVVRGLGAGMTTMRSGAVVWKYGTYISELGEELPRDCEVIYWRVNSLDKLRNLTQEEAAEWAREIAQSATPTDVPELQMAERAAGIMMGWRYLGLVNPVGWKKEQS